MSYRVTIGHGEYEVRGNQVWYRNAGTSKRFHRFDVPKDPETFEQPEKLLVSMYQAERREVLRDYEQARVRGRALHATREALLACRITGLLP